MARVFGQPTQVITPTIRGGRVFGTPSTPQADLKTIEGLQTTAEQAGLKEETEKILETKGEKPKEFFSGGVISDTFDVLNALQYGVTGLIKGKSFMEGVRTRQSFSDKDALGDFGLPGTVAGIAMDIAVDPLTYIAPISVFKKIPGAVKAAQATKEAFFATRLGQSVGSRLIYRFGQDPVYKTLDERRIKNIGVGVSNLMDIVRPITKLDATVQKTIADARKADRLEELPPELLEKAKPAFDELDKLGKEAVEVGLLKPETYQENVGRYIARLYRKHEIPETFVAKAITKISPELEPFAQEARKFKSAEEFVEAQPKLFHGTGADFKEFSAEMFGKGAGGDMFGQGVYLTDNPEIARGYASVSKTGIIKDVVIPQNVKLVDIDVKPSKKLVSKILKTLERKFPEAIRSDVIKQDVAHHLKTNDSLGGILNIIDIDLKNNFLQYAKTFSEAGDEVFNAIKEAGFDGIKYKADRIAGSGLQGTNYVIFDTKKALIKSQLTDFYNQAVKGIEKIIPSQIKVPPGAEKKPFRIDLSRFKARKDIPENVRQAMGEILEAGYPTAKAFVQLKNAVENARFFKEVNTKFAKDIIEEGLEKLPDVKTLGELAGKYVPKPIALSINEIVRIPSKTEKFINKNIVGTFKFSKVVLNPGTHGRNIASNFLLNDFEGLSPARLDIYAKAASQIAKNGDLYQEAKNAGLGIDTFASQELRSFLIGPETNKWSAQLKNALNKASDLYQSEEEFAKMAMYIFQKGKGLSPEEALKIAERATFNYAQVTPWIRHVRESIWGYPFATFTYKVTPQVTKTIAHKPTKISNIGKIKQAIENQADLKELERERANEPAWIRDGFYIKLPVKDKHGRSMYFDMTYILPFGDLVSGEFLERPISRETGLREPIPMAAIRKLPFINIIKELGKNQDFRGDKIVRDSDEPDKQATDVFRYLLKVMAPPLLGEQLPGGITSTGERRPGRIAGILEQQERAEKGEEIFGRTAAFELLRNLGLKIDPVDTELQERFMDIEKRKALETLLKESGIIREFKRPFIPK